MLDDFSIGCTVQNVLHMIAKRIKFHAYHYFRQIKPYATLTIDVVIFIRIKFIELRSSDTTTVTVALPLICPWTVASASEIERRKCSTSNRSGVTSCCCWFFFYSEKGVNAGKKNSFIRQSP